jgi:hypothetical protein
MRGTVGALNTKNYQSSPIALERDRADLKKRNRRLDTVACLKCQAMREIRTIRERSETRGSLWMVIALANAEDELAALRVREGDYLGHQLLTSVWGDFALVSPGVETGFVGKTLLELECFAFAGFIAQQLVSILGGEITD